MLWYSKGSILFYFAVNCGKKGGFQGCISNAGGAVRAAWCFLFWLRCCWPRWEPACGCCERAPCHAPGYAQCGGAQGHAAGTAALVELSNGCGRALLRRAEEVLDTLFADAAAYAQAHGLNALFLDVADAGLSSIAFRDRAYETWPGAAADDSLFHKYDPLRALCEQASQAGLAVYAVTPELSGNADWEAALARMQKKYAVAGLYVEGSALFDSISRQAVFYADEAAFNDPSSLFLASLDTDGFHRVIFDYARCRAQPEAFSVLASALDGSAARPALLEYRPAGHWRYPIRRTVRPSTPQPAL